MSSPLDQRATRLGRQGSNLHDRSNSPASCQLDHTPERRRRRDSNPHLTVLETVALPVELLLRGPSRRTRRGNADDRSRTCTGPPPLVSKTSASTVSPHPPDSATLGGSGRAGDRTPNSRVQGGCVPIYAMRPRVLTAGVRRLLSCPPIYLCLPPDHLREVMRFGVAPPCDVARFNLRRHLRGGRWEPSSLLPSPSDACHGAAAGVVGPERCSTGVAACAVAGRSSDPEGPAGGCPPSARGSREVSPISTMPPDLKVRSGGFEPPASGSAGRCSVPLSYEHTSHCLCAWVRCRRGATLDAIRMQFSGPLALRFDPGSAAHLASGGCDRRPTWRRFGA